MLSCRKIANLRLNQLATLVHCEVALPKRGIEGVTRCFVVSMHTMGFLLAPAQRNVIILLAAGPRCVTVADKVPAPDLQKRVHQLQLSGSGAASHPRSACVNMPEAHDPGKRHKHIVSGPQ